MSKTQNVDPHEIRKFEELASRWWDRNSEFKPLHDINPLRANWIDSLAPVAEQRSSGCWLWRRYSLRGPGPARCHCDRH